MSNDRMGWIDKTEEKLKAIRSKEYFSINEGDNRFVLLTHCAPQALKWTGSKYEPAEEGDTEVSIKGVAWVLQENMIKLAKFPYTVVKAIRAYQNNPDWEFDGFPWPHVINVNAKNAGTKEVDYNTMASPKEVVIDALVLEDLKKKPSPEEMVEKMKSKKVPQRKADYPQGPDPEDIPF